MTPASLFYTTDTSVVFQKHYHFSTESSLQTPHMSYHKGGAPEQPEQSLALSNT